MHKEENRTYIAEAPLISRVQRQHSHMLWKRRLSSPFHLYSRLRAKLINFSLHIDHSVLQSHFKKALSSNRHDEKGEKAIPKETCTHTWQSSDKVPTTTVTRYILFLPCASLERQGHKFECTNLMTTLSGTF